MSIIKPSIHRPSVKEVQQVFPSATGAGLILPKLGKGLHIEFRRRANFFSELNITPNTSVLYSKALFSLANAFGFLTLNNCSVPEFDGASGLSYGANQDGYFIQDSFHRDYNPFQNIYVTAMMRQVLKGKTRDEGRPEPSFYALEEDIRNATSQLDTRDLPEAVVQALCEQQKKSYRYRLFDKGEMEARDIVQRYFPAYTQAVFDMIPSDRKFVKRWEAGVWDMAIHGNDLDCEFLHGRPTGHFVQKGECPLNAIRGLEIYKG